MNRGNIPGFYYDEVKKKYFKIQANHVAPPNAKYSRSEVRREKNVRKKEKHAKRQLAVRRKQTVTRAPVLGNPLLSDCGLFREHGILEKGPARSVTATVVHGFKSASKKVPLNCLEGNPYSVTEGCYIANAFYMPEVKLLSVTAYSPGRRCSSLYCYTWDREWPPALDNDSDLNTVLVWGAESVGAVMVKRDETIISARCDAEGRVAIHTIAADDIRDWERAVYLDLKASLSAFKLQPKSEEKIACVGAGVATILDLRTHTLSPVQHRHWDLGVLEWESFAADWLNPRTLAIGITEQLRSSGATVEYANGQRQSRREPDVRHRLRLWDLRVREYIDRLERDIRITGVQAHPGDNGQIVVSSPKDISLYDLRMVRLDQKPVLSFEHHSGGPKLDFSVDPNFDTVAAVDDTGRVRTYSLYTGRFLRALNVSEDMTPLTHANKFRDLQWIDDSDGLQLRACSGHSICKWSWHGDSVDEE